MCRDDNHWTWNTPEYEPLVTVANAASHALAAFEVRDGCVCFVAGIGGMSVLSNLASFTRNG